MTAVPTSPNYERTTTLSKSVIEDPRILSRENESLNKPRKRVRIADTTPSNDNRSVEPSRTHNGGNTSEIITGYLQEKKAGAAVSKFCAFCMGTCKHTYVCKKCGYATHCSIKCYRADWYRHKFSCKLGRKIDATDYLMLACHANEFPFDEDVANKYGFMSFTSGYDRSRLFNLYRRLVIDWSIDEDELRNAVQKNKLKETLIYRCLQTGDPRMIREAEWLKSEKEFRIEGKGPRISVLCEAAQMELLSPKEKNVPILELEPLEKRQALVFYIQIQNGFIPDIHEDNWISLGFCTTTGRTSTDQLALAYESLVARCSFDEFWNAIADSRMVELFRRYRLTNRISHIRNFKYLMGIVKRWHQSVWELKRFTHTNATDPHRAVEVDYGFANCRNARQRAQLRKIYQEYFKRGEDEMRLHEACISGTLGSFLESVLGNLGVCRYLLQNPYPLEEFPLAGMVAPSVVVCTESLLDQVMALEEVDEKEILVIPDSMDEEMTSRIHERAAFLGTGMRKRRYLGHEGRITMDLTCP